MVSLTPRTLLMYNRLRCRHLARRSRRYRERNLHIPAVGAVLRSEFAVCLEVDVALILLTDRKNVAYLRPDTRHPRLEATDPIAGPAVARDLIEEISDYSDLPLLGQELRRAPIEMKIHSVLILGVGVFKIVCKTDHGLKFIASLQIKICVSSAGIDGAMSKTEICQASSVICPDWDVTSEVRHPVVHAGVPAECKLWQEISKRRARVADVEGTRERNGA